VKNGSEKSRIDWSEPCGGTGWLAEDVAEAPALREGVCDVAGFLFERDGCKDCVRDFTLLVPDESNAGQECGGSDEPNRGQQREQFAKEHEENYRQLIEKREQFKLANNRV